MVKKYMAIGYMILAAKTMKLDKETTAGLEILMQYFIDNSKEDEIIKAYEDFETA